MTIEIREASVWCNCSDRCTQVDQFSMNSAAESLLPVMEQPEDIGTEFRCQNRVIWIGKTFNQRPRQLDSLEAIVVRAGRRVDLGKPQALCNLGPGNLVCGHRQRIGVGSRFPNAFGIRNLTPIFEIGFPRASVGESQTSQCAPWFQG
jgi:hypothetical protein